MAKTLVALIATLLISFSAAAAQSKSDTRKASRPAWSELTPAQQQVLAPLQTDWEHLDNTRRKRWVAIADRYPTMKPPQQERLKKRMQEWARLTPEERTAARQRYQRLKKLPPGQRKEVQQLWEEYQEAMSSGSAPEEAQH